jgi:hypothetical protein
MPLPPVTSMASLTMSLDLWVVSYFITADSTAGCS